MQEMLADLAADYWCLPSGLTALPQPLLKSSSINVLVSWQGARRNEPNRVSWYSHELSKKTPYISQV